MKLLVVFLVLIVGCSCAGELESPGRFFDAGVDGGVVTDSGFVFDGGDSGRDLDSSVVDGGRLDADSPKDCGSRRHRPRRD